MFLTVVYISVFVIGTFMILIGFFHYALSIDQKEKLIYGYILNTGFVLVTLGVVIALLSKIFESIILIFFLSFTFFPSVYYFGTFIKERFSIKDSIFDICAIICAVFLMAFTSIGLIYGICISI